MPRNAKKSGGRFRRGRKTPSKPSKSFVKNVQKIIHLDAETKEAYHAFPLTAFNSGVDSAGDITRILPNIAQSTDDNGRIGAEIRGQKLKIAGHLILSTANNSLANSRIAVRMMIVQPKSASNWTAIQGITTSWLSSLLKKGGTNVAFTGIISDLYAPIDRDGTTVYMDKVFYLTVPWTNILNTGIAGATNIASQYVVQDLTRTVKFFNFTKKLSNKLLRYNETLDGLQPINFSPVCLMGYCHLDGSTPDVVNTQVSMCFDAQLDYEDA